MTATQIKNIKSKVTLIKHLLRVTPYARDTEKNLKTLSIEELRYKLFYSVKSGLVVL